LSHSEVGVFAILGSTFTGHYDDVETISRTLDEIQTESGLDVPIHVDAASGGFFAPFVMGSPLW
jgi:glutamate decarboxylase